MVNKFGIGTGIKQGFALIELLVSIAIFVIITTAVVVNFRVGERSTELRLTAQELATKIRRVQIMAQSGRQIEGLSLPQGYGVYITGNDFVFFADQDGNWIYDAGEEISEVTFSLPSAMIIESLEPLLPDDRLDVVFEVPGPRVWINGAEDDGTAQIQLKHEGTGQTRTITVWRVSGRVEVL